MSSNPPIDPWELAGTLVLATLGLIAYAVAGPRAALTVVWGVIAIATVTVMGYALLEGCPVDG